MKIQLFLLALILMSACAFRTKVQTQSMARQGGDDPYAACEVQYPSESVENAAWNNWVVTDCGSSQSWRRLQVNSQASRMQLSNTFRLVQESCGAQYDAFLSGLYGPFFDCVDAVDQTL